MKAFGAFVVRTAVVTWVVAEVMMRVDVGLQMGLGLTCLLVWSVGWWRRWWRPASTRGAGSRLSRGTGANCRRRRASRR